MIHRLLRAALAVAAISSFGAAQEGSATTEPPRVERPEPPKGKAEQARQRAAAEQAARERAKKFLAEHPELKQRLMTQADADGDRKLDDAEKKRLHELLEQKMRAAKERRGARADRDGDGAVEPAEKKRAREVRTQAAGEKPCEHCTGEGAKQKARTEPAAKPKPSRRLQRDA